MPKSPTKAQLSYADTWFSMNTPKQKAEEFQTANVKLLSRAQLIIMLQWNDPNGDYELLSKADLITCLKAQRDNADDQEPSDSGLYGMDTLLSKLLDTYCTYHALESDCADELLNSNRPTTEQRKWLESFVSLWTLTQELVQ